MVPSDVALSKFLPIQEISLQPVAQSETTEPRDALQVELDSRIAEVDRAREAERKAYSEHEAAMAKLVQAEGRMRALAREIHWGQFTSGDPVKDFIVAQHVQAGYECSPTIESQTETLRLFVDRVNALAGQVVQLSEQPSQFRTRGAVVQMRGRLDARQPVQFHYPNEHSRQYTVALQFEGQHQQQLAGGQTRDVAPKFGETTTRVEVAYMLITSFEQVEAEQSI